MKKVANLLSAPLLRAGFRIERSLIGAVMKKHFLFSFIITAALFFAAANVFAQKDSNPQTGNSDAAITIPKIVQINEFSIKELLKPKDKPLLINFWATWCIPCREEFPDLVDIDKEFTGKIDFITITLDDPAEIERDVKKFLTEMKATMPTYLLYTPDESEVIGSISKDWAGGLPFTVLYDEAGKLVMFKQGKIKHDVVTTEIRKLLATSKSTAIFERANKVPSPEESYQRGIADARKDIENKIYVVQTYGLSTVEDGLYRRKLTKTFKIEFRGFGCTVTNNEIEYVRGYNEISKPEIEKTLGLKL